MGLLRTYCNQDETVRQLDGLVAEARGQIRGAAPRRVPQPPRSACKGKHLPTETERAIAAEYQAGKTMNAIATKHGIHRVTVGQVLDRTDTAKRPKGMTPGQVDMAARLYESGLSLADVGAQLGFDAATIRMMLLQRGVKTRDSHGRSRIDHPRTSLYLPADAVLTSRSQSLQYRVSVQVSWFHQSRWAK